MKDFKFLTKNKQPAVRARRWIGMDMPGRIYWIHDMVGYMHYVEESETYEGEYNMSQIQMQMRSIPIICNNRMIRSINDFMDNNQNKIVMVYKFINQDPGSPFYAIPYNENNFHDAPRDVPMIFVGVVRSINVFE